MTGISAPLLPFMKSAVQCLVLCRLLERPHISRSAGELAQWAGCSTQAVLDILSSGQSCGVLRTTKRSRTRLASAADTSPMFDDLRRVLLFAYGPLSAVPEELSRVPGTQAVAFEGNRASALSASAVPAGTWDEPTMAVVVGDPDLWPSYAKAADVASRRTGVSTRVRILTRDEWEAGADNQRSTLRTVVASVPGFLEDTPDGWHLELPEKAREAAPAMGPLLKRPLHRKAVDLSDLLKSGPGPEILSAILECPGDSWSAAELARTAGVSRSTALREASRAVDAGLVLIEDPGRPVLGARANRRHPVIDEIRRILMASCGAATHIAELLSGVDGVSEVVIFGSWAARYFGEPGSRPGDIDVLVVGQPAPGAAIQPADTARSRMLGRRRIPVNPVVTNFDNWDSTYFGRSLRENPTLSIWRASGVDSSDKLQPDATKSTAQ